MLVNKYKNIVRFKILTEFVMKITVFLAVTPYILVEKCQISDEVAAPVFKLENFTFTSEAKIEDFNSLNLWKVDRYLPDYRVSQMA